MKKHIEVVEVWQTLDGEQHTTRQEAVDHIIDVLGAKMNEMFKEDTAASDRLGYNSIYYTLLALIGSEKKYLRLHRILNSMVTQEYDEEED